MRGQGRGHRCLGPGGDGSPAAGDQAAGKAFIRKGAGNDTEAAAALLMERHRTEQMGTGLLLFQRLFQFGQFIVRQAEGDEHMQQATAGFSLRVDELDQGKLGATVGTGRHPWRGRQIVVAFGVGGILQQQHAVYFQLPRFVIDQGVTLLNTDQQQATSHANQADITINPLHRQAIHRQAPPSETSSQ